jgi:type IV pilus assembly protein PilP
MRARNSSFAALCLASLLSACGGNAPVKSTAAAAKKPAAVQPAAPQETAPSGPAYVYIYNPVGKRDPFRSPVTTVVTGPEGQCTEPLCQWDLDQLSLVAVVTGDANPFAMVEDPHGRGYIVRRNTKIGKQGGKVTQILRDSVTVTEFWTAPDGTQKPNYLSLQLKPDKVRLPELDLISGKTF